MYTAGWDLVTMAYLEDDDIDEMLASLIPETKKGHRLKLKKAIKKLQIEKQQTDTRAHSGMTPISPAMSPKAATPPGEATPEETTQAHEMMMMMKMQQATAAPQGGYAPPAYLQGGQTMCKQCQSKPRQRGHEYCGLTCARAYGATKAHPPGFFPGGAGAGAAVPYGVIKFYDKQGSYFELTNYWDRNNGGDKDQQLPRYPKRLIPGKYLFHEGGTGWRSSEHRFQIHKILDPDRQRLYNIAKDIGTGAGEDYIGPKWADKNIWRGGLERGDWSNVKMKVMYNTLKMKFEQKGLCHDVLKKTRGNLLVEDSGVNDFFWGNGAARIDIGDGRGGYGTEWTFAADYNEHSWNQNLGPNSKIPHNQRGYNWLGLLLVQVRDIIFRDDFCITQLGRLPFDTTAHGLGADGYFHDGDAASTIL